MIKHINSGACPKCLLLFNRYPGFHPGLFAWFVGFQKQHPDAHISCAGRGKSDQEQCFKLGYSSARWGQSSHNFNCALDLFRLTQQGLTYDAFWFKTVVYDAIKEHNDNPTKQFTIDWYGAPNSPFFELPHCQVKDWKTLGYALVEEKKK